MIEAGIQGKLSVLTFNLRFGLADDGDNNWQFRKTVFPELLDTYRADFMAFQEVNDFQARFLADLLPDYGVVGQRTPAPPFWQNNLIFYLKDWECEKFKHFFLSPTPHIPSRFRGSRWPRQCSMGLFKNQERKLICLATHFDFDAEVQAHSAQVILKQVSEFPAHVPAVLMGDFNAPPSAPCYEVFTREHPDNQEIPAFKNAFSPPFPPTHHGFSGARIGDHIDWILFRGRLKPEKTGVMNEKIQGRYPSDHFPVYAVLGWE
jgi:endonuclease/exonuclease/phosphatase family metal-dependent hydrolase